MPKNKGIRLILVVGVILIASVAIIISFRNGESYIEGSEIRLIDALDDGVVQLSPLAGPAPSENAARDRAEFEKGLRRSKSLTRACTAPPNGLTFHVKLGDDSRGSIVLAPPTQLSYKVRIPNSAQLRFALGTALLKDGASPRGNGPSAPWLLIKVKQRGRSAQIVFSLSADALQAGGRDQWKDFAVPLKTFGGKRVNLTIEAKEAAGIAGPRRVFYMAAPTIAADSPASSGKPNIIILVADALRADRLSCYGYGRPTSPNIDRFSRESILFENALSQAPWTLPSLASLLTSSYPSFHGATEPGTRLLPASTTLIGILRGAGYTTAACVRNQYLNPKFGLIACVDLYCGSLETSEQQLPVISGWLESLRGRPYFLFVHFLLPHAPYQAPPPFGGAFRAPGLPLVDMSNEALNALEERKRPPAAAELEVLKASYDETILYLDSLVGKLLEGLQKQGLYQDSLIIFVSDHGEQFWEHEHLLHGHTLYQEEVHTPLLIKPPRGSGPPPCRVSGRALNIDVMPTVLDLLKIAPPADVQGRSLWPLIRGEGGAEETVFSEHQALGQTAAWKGPFKYIFTDPEAQAQGSSRLQLKSHQPHPVRFLEELYNLDEDPGETRNLIGGRPDLADFFRKEVGTLAERAARYRLEKFKSPYANRIKLSNEDKEKLRALGYLR